VTRAIALCALLEVSAACSWRSASSGAVHLDEQAQAVEHEETTTTAPVREETVVERWTVTPSVGRAVPRGPGVADRARPWAPVKGNPGAAANFAVSPLDPYVYERETRIVDLAPVATSKRDASSSAKGSASAQEAAGTRAGLGTGFAFHIALACAGAALAALAWRFRRLLPVVGPLFAGGDK
jgi:hypothetical protein